MLYIHITWLQLWAVYIKPNKNNNETMAVGTNSTEIMKNIKPQNEEFSRSSGTYKILAGLGPHESQNSRRCVGGGE